MLARRLWRGSTGTYSGDRVGLLAYGQGISSGFCRSRRGSPAAALSSPLAQLRAEPSEADHLKANGYAEPPATPGH